MAAINSVDLRKVEEIGPVSLLRAEWKDPNARFVLVWYAVRGHEQPLALRLDLDKRVFLDDIDDAVKAHASDVSDAVAMTRREMARASLLKQAADH